MSSSQLNTAKLLLIINSFKLILKSAFPIIVSMAIIQLYSFQNYWFISKGIGMNAIAVFAIASVYIHAVLSIVSTVTQPAIEEVEKAYRENRLYDLKSAVTTLTYHSVFSGLVAMSMSLVLAEPFCSLIHTPDALYSQTVLFIKVFSFTFLPISLYTSSSRILAVLGEFKLPLIVEMMAFLASGTFNYLFVLILHVGVNSVVYSSFISQCFSAMVCLFLMNSRLKVMRVPKTKSFINLRVIRKCYTNNPRGLILAVTSSVSFFAAQYYVNLCGIAAIAGFAIYLIIEQFVLIPVMAVKPVMKRYTSNHADEKDKSEALRTFNIVLFTSMLYTAAISCLIFFLDETYIRLINSNEFVVFCGCYVIQVAVPYLTVVPMLEITASALEGFKMDKIVLTVTLFVRDIFRIILLVFVCSLAVDLNSIAITLPLSRTISAGILVLYFFIFFHNQFPDSKLYKLRKNSLEKYAEKLKNKE